MASFVKLNDDQVAFTEQLQRLGFISIDRKKHELLVDGEYWTRQATQDRANLVKAIAGYINSESASEQYLKVFRKGDLKPLGMYDSENGFSSP